MEAKRLDAYKILPAEVKKQRRLNKIIFMVILSAFVLSTVQTGFNPFIIFIKGENFVDFFVNHLSPPNFKATRGLWEAIMINIGMAIIPTFIGGIIAFCLCFFASYSTTPHKSFVLILRGFASFWRNLPSTIWMTILVMVFGIGTTIGIIALTINTVGFLLRAFTDVVDEVGKESMEALDSLGAGFLPKLFQCVIPAAMPGFISWLLYAVEINVMSSGIIGALGGGGIGLVLTGYFKLFKYRAAFAIIIMLGATIIVVNFITNYLRKKVIA